MTVCGLGATQAQLSTLTTLGIPSALTVTEARPLTLRQSGMILLSADPTPGSDLNPTNFMLRDSCLARLFFADRTRL